MYNNKFKVRYIMKEYSINFSLKTIILQKYI